MAEEIAAAGLPPLEIEERGECVTVRFRHGRPAPSSRGGEVHLTEQQKAVLDLLEASDRALARREIRSRLTSPPEDRRLSKDLDFLRSKGLAILTGRGRSAKWKRA